MRTERPPLSKGLGFKAWLGALALLMIAGLWLTQLVLPTSAAAQASLPEPPVQIVFASDRDTGAYLQSEIYIMDPDGTNVRRLTIGFADALAPDISPDGTQILFYSTVSGNEDIYVMDVDGSNITNLTNTPSSPEYSPVWSPDGTQIAFWASREKNFDIYMMDADGSNVRRLTTNPEWDSHPSWSPDGTRIAFQSKRDGDSEIYVINVDDLSLVQLTHNSAQDFSPDWSPDGTQLVFVSLRYSGRYDVWLMNADGSSQTNVTNTSQGWETVPRWSPDGQWIAFSSLPQEGDRNWDVSVIRPNGTGRINLTVGSPAVDWYPSWGVLASPATPTPTPTFTPSPTPTATPTPAPVPPVAVAGTSLDANGLLELNGSLSTDPDGTIVGYRWQIVGEGNPRTGQVVSIADLPMGEYVVELTVTDNDGATGADVMLLGVPIGHNLSPIVSSDQGIVEVDEGETATNSGTVSDPNNDQVTLSASIGMVINSGDGTWAWSFPTTDGPGQSQMVTIYADDGKGGTGETVFELVVKNVAPTVNAGQDQIVGEGSSVDFFGSFNDPSSADTHIIEWNFGDGSTETGSLTPIHTYANDGVYTVTLTVTDDDSGVGTDTLSVTVENVAPDAANDTYDVVEGETLTESAPGILSNDSDAGNDPLTAILVGDVSNGTLALNADGSFIYTPDAGFIGTDIFIYTANDGELNSNEATVTITITDLTPPTINISDITAPPDGYLPSQSIDSFPATVGAQPLVMSGTSSDNVSVASVEVNGIPATLQPDDSWTTVGIPLGEGDNTLTIVATDTSGNPTIAEVQVALNFDLDDDGIRNSVDKAPPGPFEVSTQFSDETLGGMTSGRLLDKCVTTNGVTECESDGFNTGVVVDILDAPIPDGIRVIVGGPANGFALVRLDCSKAKYTLTPGEYVLTCNTVTLIALQGTARAEFITNSGVILVVVEAVSTVHFDEIIMGGELRELVVTVEAGTVTVNNISVPPGESLTVIPVSIDIKPGSDPNAINCKNPNGVITIAILSTNKFDATSIDPNTVRFGPAGAKEIHRDKDGKAKASIEDVNGDGLDDMVLHFRYGDTGLTCGDETGELSGWTYEGAYIMGLDKISNVPANGPPDKPDSHSQAK